MDFFLTLKRVTPVSSISVLLCCFTLAGCADKVVESIEPSSQTVSVQTQHHQQLKQMVAIEQQIQALYRFETDFPANFHHTPSHQTVWQTGAKLPTFLDNMSSDHYLGALKHKLANQPMNNYQLQQLLNHQKEALEKAVLLDNKLAAMADEYTSAELLDNYRGSLQQVISLHRQTMAHLLVSLMRNALVAAEKTYDEIGTVVSTQNYQAKSDEVWQHSIKPITQKQWRQFDKKYLQQINAVRAVLVANVDKNDKLTALFSQTYPHAMLSYKYFWPETDLPAYLEQGAKRKREANKMFKLLNSVALDDFAQHDLAKWGLVRTGV